jgi:TolB-like protein/AraC-like DNA-binding protein/Tfp pilus assembly protein PilF
LAENTPVEKDFLKRVTTIIEDNLSDERFGVSELAGEIGMSRSNLLRKIKKSSGLSVSQFISQIRLQHAMELLKQQSMTVSEVSYEVGFGSTSYFIKCFREHYGYPPGEVEKRDSKQSDVSELVQGGKEQIATQNKLIKFWEELKRRKVVKVIVIYASISFILLQVVSILIEPLFLPDWMMSLVIVLLAIGFPIAIVFSWIFEITPSGLEVTQATDKNGNPLAHKGDRKMGILNMILIGLLVVIIGILVYPKMFGSVDQEYLNPKLEKSIAVLPFINDSNDSTNVHIINGLMESILNKLQKIEDLRVVSRTSVEKYRKDPKTIPEMAKELKVSYFVEGSGQKIGDKILLNVQLIEASSDKHLWAEQFNRETKDIFNLQQEVAKKIANKIEVIITPEEEERIDKIPTDNLEAYEYFLKGKELFFMGTFEGLEEAIPYFKKAVELDIEFANAYADIAIAYYYMDIFKAEKRYTELIKDYADKAMMFDSKSAQSLIAKGFFYINSGKNELATTYFEKALEFNPNSALVINTLSDVYANRMPDTEKYLEYALKGVQLDIASHDSITASFIYLHVSNAFIQSGFIGEAEMYINKSLDYSPENLFSEYVKAYILYAKNKDLTITKELLIKAYNKDLTRLDILQEIGKICYYMRDYESSYAYYSKFIEIKEAQQLDIYRFENAKIGLVLEKMGQVEKSEKYFEDYKDYAENDRSIYKDLSLAVYYSYQGDTKKAIEHMKIFSQQDNYQIWVIIFLKMDPLVDKIKELPEFQALLKTIESKFWIKHKEIRASLEEKGLI